MAMGTPYSYSSCPLKEAGDIRVLTIAQGGNKPQREDTIKCKLTTQSLKSSKDAESVKYEALSYHWGTGKVDTEIEILSAHGFHIFKIKPDLHAALKQLRLPDNERVLWIDAICINQEDSRERGSQVSIMADIYEKATRVCVWLGPATDDSCVAMSFINKLVDLETFDQLVVDPGTSAEWTALSSLMRRPWFSRRWVVQEIAFAKKATLYCGRERVDWSEFADAVSLFESAESKGRLISKNLMHSSENNHAPDSLGEFRSLGATRLVDATNNLFRKSAEGQILEKLSTLDALISNLSSFESSRAHDIIYSMLALAKDVTPITKANEIGPYPPESQIPDGEDKAYKTRIRTLKKWIKHNREKKFQIDYEKPFFDVCKDFITFTVRYSSSLDVICRPWIPKTGLGNQKRPSWLLPASNMAFGLRPDRHYSRTNADPLVGTPGLGKSNYNASSRLQASNKWRFGEGEDGSTMYVEGFIVDKVKTKKSSAMQGIIPYEWLEAGEWTKRTDVPPDPFWRTLVADRGPNGSNPPSYYPRACQFALNQTVEGSDIVTSSIINSGKSEIVAEFLRRVQDVIWRRRLIITEHDVLGLGPKNTEEGDLICIFYQCSVPVMLRKRVINSEENAPVVNGDSGTFPGYEFVGECYVDGLMNGEASEIAKSRNNGEIPKQTFELQ